MTALERWEKWRDDISIEFGPSAWWVGILLCPILAYYDDLLPVMPEQLRKDIEAILTIYPELMESDHDA